MRIGVQRVRLRTTPADGYRLSRNLRLEARRDFRACADRWPLAVSQVLIFGDVERHEKYLRAVLFGFSPKCGLMPCRIARLRDVIIESRRIRSLRSLSCGEILTSFIRPFLSSPGAGM
jgi:hypothetical protein